MSICKERAEYWDLEIETSLLSHSLASHFLNEYDKITLMLSLEFWSLIE